MDKVSIVVPIYNVEKYLNECVNSIVKQTYKNIEIILVNDGSKDDSDSICKEWEVKDKRIKYVFQKNQGVSVARNNGINSSTGNYIMFVDGDDFLEETMVEKLYNKIIEKKTEISCCNYYIVKNNEKKAIKYFEFEDLIDVQKNKKLILEKVITDFGVPWGKLYKKDLLTKNNFSFKIGLKRMQDTIFNLDVFNYVKKIGYVDEPLYDYRIFQDSATNKYSPKFNEIAKDVLKYFEEFLNKNNLWEEYKYLYYSKMLILIIETIKLKYIPDECNLNYFKKRKEIIREIKEFNLNFKNVSLKFLDKNNRIGFRLIQMKLYDIFYLIYKTNYKRKKKKAYK